MQDNLAPETSYPAILGRIIVQEREKRVLAQSTLAREVGIGQSTWSRIERGESAFTIEQLNFAANALKVSPGYLITKADQAVEALRSRGVHVRASRSGKSDEVLAWIGAAALGLLILRLVKK